MKIISIIITILTFGLDKICLLIDKSKRHKITEIAKIVESLYRGLPPEEKKAAFLQLCAMKNISLNYADKFLENYIIPTTKAINNYIDKMKQAEDTIKGAV